MLINLSASTIGSVFLFVVGRISDRKKANQIVFHPPTIQKVKWLLEIENFLEILNDF